MGLSSLKAFIPRVAGVVSLTPAALYERQRELVRAALLPVERGRGPGSGVRATPSSVAMMVTALLAADTLLELGERTRLISHLRPWDAFLCPFTDAPTFVDAVAAILGSSRMSARVAYIAVSRTESHAHIAYRERGRLKTSAFGLLKGAGEVAAFSVEARLHSDAIEEIASALREA